MPRVGAKHLKPGVAALGHSWTSLVVQLLRIHLPTQVTLVQSLIRENSTCRGATKPVCRNYRGLHVPEPVLHDREATANNKPVDRS